MAKKIKSLTSNVQPKVTTLKLANGNHTEIGKETCEELMTKHFPTHKPKFHPEYNYTKISTTEITKQEYKPWITQSKERASKIKSKKKFLVQTKSNP